MNEMTPRSGAELARLDGLASEARAYSEAIQANMLQLGRVFTEAKTLVKHGEWGRWLEENSGMTERNAQLLMQAYSRFGTDEQYARLGKSKLIKMLQLPEGSEKAFVAGNDVQAMTAREVEAAVKQVRAEMTAAMNTRIEAAERMLDDERKSREAAEKLAQEMARQPRVINTAEPPKELLDKLAAREKELAEAKQTIEQMAEHGDVELRETKRLLEIARKENESLQDEMDGQADRLDALEREKRQAEAEVQRLQDELDNAEPQVMMPAYRLEMEEMEEMEAAIHTFMSACSRLPLMGHAFAEMSANECEKWDKMLLGIEMLGEGARRIMQAAIEAAQQRDDDPYGYRELLGDGRSRTVRMGGFEVTLEGD